MTMSVSNACSVLHYLYGFYGQVTVVYRPYALCDAGTCIMLSLTYIIARRSTFR